MKLYKKVLFGVGVLVLYLVSVIPVGLGLYALKSWMGYDISLKGGFHSFQKCMANEVALYQGASSAVNP